MKNATKRLIVLDVETTTSNKGNPSDVTNKLCYIGLKYLDTQEVLLFNTLENNYASLISSLIENNVVIGFNLKFDIRWLLNYGISIDNTKFIDLQIAYFLYKNQQVVMPSLNQVAEEFGLPQKLDVVKSEYWDKGIDTNQIPKDILEEYLAEDLNITGLVYQELFKVFPQSKNKLLTLQCLDMVILSRAELEGLTYDQHALLLLSKITAEQIAIFRSSLNTMYPSEHINWNSGHHVSAILFGGGISYDNKQPIGRYKSGKRAGEVKYRTVVEYTNYPQLCKPDPDNEIITSRSKTEEEVSASGRTYKTSSDILTELVKRNPKNTILVETITNLLGLSVAEKLYSTYLVGIPELCLQSNWLPGKIHGQFNQCVTATGRLSSSKPNLQNLPPETDVLLVSKYK